MFYGLNTAFTLLSFVGIAIGGIDVVSLISNLIALAISTYIVVLIWQPDSTQFIHQVTAYEVRRRGYA